MKKLMLTFILCTVFLLPTQAQLTWETMKERLYVGGNTGLSFGGGDGFTIFNAELSPLVGIRLTEDFSAGVGVINQYSRQSFKNYFGITQVLNLYNFGGRLFGKYELFENVFAYTEYEALQLQGIVYNPTSAALEKQPVGVGSLFVGGGYRNFLSERWAVEVMVLANLNDSRFSPYANPIVRVGLVRY